MTVIKLWITGFMWKNIDRADDMAAIGHAHPIPIGPVDFASEVDRFRFVALNWCACDLGGTPSAANQFSFLTPSRGNLKRNFSHRGMCFLPMARNLIT
jgi:hypothetical protein